MKINYTDIFNKLWFHHENEVVEFKEAKESFDWDELGRYFSALSNEANLRGEDFAWLIFGVENKKRQIVGTHYKQSPQALQRIKNDLAQGTTGGLSFREIAEIKIEEKRILLFQIPATPRNIVMCWKKIPYARIGESLKPLDQGKQDEIRNQSPVRDWSGEVIKDWNIEDLDELALAKARIEFAKVHKERIPAAEINNWTTEDFLKYSGVLTEEGLTRAGLVLLGKPTASYKLNPAVVQITWVLQDENDVPLDYEHFTIPYLLTVDKVLGKIRNLTMRDLPEGTLFPDIEQQYDNYSMREVLHNCIAHMDYRMEERITLVERPGELIYANGGEFVPGTIENVLKTYNPQRYYRNRCLCRAMVNFNMIDTIGRGINKIFSLQKERYFPMPDYVIDTNKREVKVTVYGKMIDEKYTQLLKQNKTLSLNECIWLDAVQKNRPIGVAAIKHLRSKGLIEGRAPYYTISLAVAQKTKQLTHYNQVKGLERGRLRQMVEQFIETAQNGVTRKEIIEYIKPALPTARTEEQKLWILSNLLKELRQAGIVYSDGKHWHLTPKQIQNK